ncbi:peptidoglycan-binding protein [Peribacillus butanolivorans]
MTKQALINFQEANNLSADGVAGSMTWEALDSYYKIFG